MSVSCLVTKLLNLLEIKVTTPSLAFSELGWFILGGFVSVMFKKEFVFLCDFCFRDTDYVSEFKV